MPFVDLPIYLVTRELDQGIRLAQAVQFPEVVALHDRTEKLHAAVTKLARELVAGASPIDVHRRVCAAEPVPTEVTVEVAPPAKSGAWVEPVRLRFDVLRWRRGEQASIAMVPALGIQVVAGRDDE